jgi:hypothetical protein
MSRIIAVTIALIATSGITRADGPSVITVRNANDLVRLSRSDLEAVYRVSDIGTIPLGSTRGTAIFKPGSRMTMPASRVTRVLWQGKYFKDDVMVNRVLGVRAIDTRTYISESWLDGKPSFILDYYDTTKLFKDVRDEVREVSPGLYLGAMYFRKPDGPELAMFFTLESKAQGRPSMGI